MNSNGKLALNFYWTHYLSSKFVLEDKETKKTGSEVDDKERRKKNWVVKVDTKNLKKKSR